MDPMIVAQVRLLALCLEIDRPHVAPEARAEEALRRLEQQQEGSEEGPEEGAEALRVLRAHIREHGFF